MEEEPIKTLDSGASWLYALSWPLGVGGEKKEAFVIAMVSSWLSLWIFYLKKF